MDTDEKANQVQKEGKKKSSAPGRSKKPARSQSSPSRKSTTRQSLRSAAGAERTAEPADKVKKLYRVKFFYEWCKSCGICCALCPKKIILLDEHGNPLIEDMDECIGCRNCEIHCPDFAITVKRRHPERRKSNGFR